MKAEEVNKLVVQKLAKDDTIEFVENHNMGARGLPIPNYYENDGIHLTHEGTRQLASNMKATLGKTLKIKREDQESRRENSQRQRQRWDQRETWRENSNQPWKENSNQQWSRRRDEQDERSYGGWRR